MLFSLPHFTASQRPDAGIGQPDKQTPPVVYQRHAGASRRQRFKSCVVKPPSAPVDLQLIKRVLAIRTAPVDMAPTETAAPAPPSRHRAGHSRAAFLIRSDGNLILIH